MTCEHCQKPFFSLKAWARFCSEPCRRHAFRKTRREDAKQEVAKGLVKCSNDNCGNPFSRVRLGQIYCSDRCRRITNNRLRRQRLALEKVHQPKAKRKRRSLLCHWCRGAHVSTRCPNRAGATVKLFGTQGPNGEYVPPPGVKVRVLEVPHALHGDELEAILKSNPRLGAKRRHIVRAARRIANPEVIHEPEVG